MAVSRAAAYPLSFSAASGLYGQSAGMPRNIPANPARIKGTIVSFESCLTVGLTKPIKIKRLEQKVEAPYSTSILSFMLAM